MPELQRRGPLNASNPSASNAVEGEIAIGPCRHIDRRPVELLAEIAAKLYAVVAAARTVEPKDADPRKNARHHLMIATFAIAATQAETIVTLVSCDLHKTSEVHVRSLGELAKRCQFLVDDSNLDTANEMFESLEASRKALANKVPEDHELHAIVDRIYVEVDGPTMEKIETRMNQSAGLENLAISTFERKIFSKWAHGDIVALADAGDQIRAAGKDLRSALNLDRAVASVLLRAIVFALILLACSPAVKVGTASDVRSFAQRAEEYARETQTTPDRLIEVVRAWIASQPSAWAE